MVVLINLRSVLEAVSQVNKLLAVKRPKLQKSAREFLAALFLCLKYGAGNIDWVDERFEGEASVADQK